MKTTAALLLTLALTGCAATAEPSAAPAAPVQPPASATPSRCLDTDTEWLERIAGGARDDVGTLTLSRIMAVKSNSFSSVYMLAGEFSGEGIDNAVGVWASNSLTPGEGLILSVDEFAKQFTVWPDADKSSADIDSNDDGVQAARDCLSS